MTTSLGCGRPAAQRDGLPRSLAGGSGSSQPHRPDAAKAVGPTRRTGRTQDRPPDHWVERAVRTYHSRSLAVRRSALYGSANGGHSVSCTMYQQALQSVTCLGVGGDAPEDVGQLDGDGGGQCHAGGDERADELHWNLLEGLDSRADIQADERRQDAMIVSSSGHPW